MGILERIADIQKELARTQKNKATESHRCRLKAQLAKLQSELLDPGPGAGGGEAEGFEVSKTGNARIALIGFPSVGKSTLLSTLTGTESTAAAYEFTTLTCVPGNIFYKNTKLQLLDLPGIIEGAAQGKGRGRQVIAVAKSSDLVLMVLDAAKEFDGQSNHREILENELESVGMRLNKTPPDIYFKKKPTGGVKISVVGSFGGLSKFGDDAEYSIKGILHEYRIHNCELIFREDASPDDFIDVIEGNRKYVRCLYVYNKVDMVSVEALDKMVRDQYNSCAISAGAKLGLDWLMERIWEDLALVRIYTKPPGASPDFSEPVILTKGRHGTTVESACVQIHRKLVEDFSRAFVYGISVKHQPQCVGLQHVLEDEDVVRIVKKANSVMKKSKDYTSRVQAHWDEVKQKRKNKQKLKT
jgi:small GTP-binding protein